MNGGAINLSEFDPDIRAAHGAHLDQVLAGMRGLHYREVEQARQIQQTLMPEEYRQAERIPTDVWVSHARGSWSASCQAWLGFNGLSDFAQLRRRMLHLYAIGRVKRPEQVPPADWTP